MAGLLEDCQCLNLADGAAPNGPPPSLSLDTSVIDRPVFLSGTAGCISAESRRRAYLQAWTDAPNLTGEVYSKNAACKQKFQTGTSQPLLGEVVYVFGLWDREVRMVENMP
jgi:hypothetical protein